MVYNLIFRVRYDKSQRNSNTIKVKDTKNYWILIQLLQYYVMRGVYKLILILLSGISPKYYSISHYNMEKGIVYHNNNICIYIGLNRSNYIASSTQFI